MSSLTLGQPKEKDDDYFTPKDVWKSITNYIPKDRIIWEAFYNKDSPSPNALREIGCQEVISENEDFFKVDCGDVIVSNPPYSCKKKIFERLKFLNKPFILIVPVSIITKAYFRQTGFANKCGLIIPAKRIHFIKGKEQTSKCWFDTIFICYKIDGVREKEIIFL